MPGQNEFKISILTRFLIKFGDIKVKGGQGHDPVVPCLNQALCLPFN